MVVPSVTRPAHQAEQYHKGQPWGEQDCGVYKLWRWKCCDGDWRKKERACWCDQEHKGNFCCFLSTHKGSFETIHIQDSTGHEFTTWSRNVFTIGKWTRPWVSRPKGKGIKLSLIKEASVESEFGWLGLDEQNSIVDYFKGVLLIRKEWSYNVREQEKNVSWPLLECAGKLQVNEKE